MIARESLGGVATRGTETTGANVVIVRDSFGGVARRGAETTGANLVVTSARSPGVERVLVVAATTGSKKAMTSATGSIVAS